MTTSKLGNKIIRSPKKPVGPRVSDETSAWLAENFRSKSSGAEHVLESHRVLYSRTLQELKGHFKREELMAMIDVMNAHMLNPFTSGTELPLALRDAMDLDGLAEKWEIDGKELDTKISLLCIYQVAVLEWWANGFWYGGGEDRPERDIEEYVAVLL
jgi:hypothetical protein